MSERMFLAVQCGAQGSAGREYEVRAISEGKANGLIYSAEALRAGVGLFEGASVFVDHAQMAEMWGAAGNRSLRNLVGVLRGVSTVEDVGGMSVCGTLHVLPGPDSDWLCAVVDSYLGDRGEGRTVPAIGLSAVLDVEVVGGAVSRISKVVSVDAVVDPARGGTFLRALNAQQESEGGDVAKVVVAGEVAAGEAVAVGDSRGAVVAGADPVAVAAAPVVVPAAPTQRESWEESFAALNAMVLESRLDKCGLPAPLRELLRQECGGKVVKPSELDARVDAMKAAWAASVAQGVPVHGVGAGTVQVGLSEGDRLQAAMDRLCGLKPKSELLAGVAPVSGIRELYLMCTGDWEFQGAFHRDRVSLANVTTATMTSLVKNAFNKVILDYFGSVDRWWESIASQEDFGDMKDITLITLGGFDALPTVAEGAAYTELSWSDAEEVVSFVKKGAYVGVTLEMMDMDETRKFRAIPQKLAIAGYRTLGALVSALFTANSGVGPYWPAGQTSLRLFNSGTYVNLGAAALSVSTWDACVQSMYQMTEATSGAVMGIRPAVLMVPIELEKTALTIMGSVGEPGTGDNDINVRRESSRVVVVPNWTNAANWAAVADPRVWPGVVIGYRYGRVPEVFIAGEETVGSMFTNDEMRVKARYVVAVGVGDYRALYKANI